MGISHLVGYSVFEIFVLLDLFTLLFSRPFALVDDASSAGNSVLGQKSAPTSRRRLPFTHTRHCHVLIAASRYGGCHVMLSFGWHVKMESWKAAAVSSNVKMEKGQSRDATSNGTDILVENDGFDFRHIALLVAAQR